MMKADLFLRKITNLLLLSRNHSSKQISLYAGKLISTNKPIYKGEIISINNQQETNGNSVLGKRYIGGGTGTSEIDG